MSTACKHKYDIRYSMIEGVKIGCTECRKAAQTNRKMDDVNGRICTVLIALGYLLMIWTGMEGLGWKIALMAAWFVFTILISGWLGYRYLLYARDKGRLEKYIRMTDNEYAAAKPKKKGKFSILSTLMDEGVDEFDDYNYEEGFDECDTEEFDLFPDCLEGEEAEALNEEAMMKLLERMELFEKEMENEEQPEAADGEEEKVAAKAEETAPHRHSWHVEYRMLSGLYADCPECGVEGKRIRALMWSKRILLTVILLISDAYLLFRFDLSAELAFQLLFVAWLGLYLLLSWLEYCFLRRAEQKDRLGKYICLAEEA